MSEFKYHIGNALTQYTIHSVLESTEFNIIPAW